MSELKQYYEAYKKAQAESNKLDEMIEAHPEDQKIEEAWDIAYEKEYLQFGLLADHIAQITGMSTADARLIVMERPAELAALMERIA